MARNYKRRNRTTHAQKLLALLQAAGPAGLPNASLASHVGWNFSETVRFLRGAGHVIETQRIPDTKHFRTILLQDAPAPELPPIFALMAEKARQ